MSHQAHFWLRVIGLAVIVLAEFGPRLWTATTPTPSSHVVASALPR